MENWYVYMIRCGSGAIYTGITTNVDRRFAEHQTSGPQGRTVSERKGAASALACSACRRTWGGVEAGAQDQAPPTGAKGNIDTTPRITAGDCRRR